MPEGHTLLRLALRLSDAFAGHPVRVSSPQGRFAAEAAELDGSVLIEATSAGKHLFVEFAGDRFIHIHLGLIGGFGVHDDVEEVPLPVGQVRLRLARGPLVPGGRSAYADLRGATRCDLVTGGDVARVIAGLGADPLKADADPESAWRKIRASARTIGELLMDQSVLAGVGNVYRAEILFRHRIHPDRPGNRLQRRQFIAMWDDLSELMAEGVRTGRIDTVRPEHTPEAMGREARVDDHGGEVYVYRRTGQPCLICGRPVQTRTLAGRNAFWCPNCQRKPRATT